MGRATKAESDATRRRILDCAREMLAERGYPDVGLDEIAMGAGVTRGAVYHHFGNRRGVFDAVHAWAQDEVARAIVLATQGISDPWQALKIGCRAFMDTSVREDVRRILLVDAPAVVGWGAWRDLDAQGSARLLGDALADLDDVGALQIDSIGACHALLSGAMNEAALRAASLEPAERGVAEAWPTLERMLDAIRVR
ncbi:TetR/AcrR family transcriptional regulator [Microbacterium halotolerans]|uniref:TetR/AcrR family transcriptional regulator n=1 Tax=Microbacterium halotolerans TaxID=246613 RepID=UPI000E6AA642|nr:TetR/AcrR family transcriptional regulator [Microbacterium halotolerans]